MIATYELSMISKKIAEEIIAEGICFVEKKDKKKRISSYDEELIRM